MHAATGQPQSLKRRSGRPFAEPQLCSLRVLLPNHFPTGKHYREFLFTVTRCNPSEKVAAQRSVCVSALREVFTRVRVMLMADVESVSSMSKRATLNTRTPTISLFFGQFHVRHGLPPRTTMRSSEMTRP